jgi:hypothetical protein
MKEELTLTKQALAKVLDENTILRSSNSSIFVGHFKWILGVVLNEFFLCLQQEEAQICKKWKLFTRQRIQKAVLS